MKLYMHPVSMTSRPARLFIAENGIDVDEQMVDVMAGEHYQEAFTVINPSRQVPVLEDGDLCLTESSAILKYLADKIGSRSSTTTGSARTSPICAVSGSPSPTISEPAC